MSTTNRSPKKVSVGQTGPKTSAGKITSSRNAIKTGIHVSGWIDSTEESEYQDLFNNLCLEYNAQTTTLLLQVERMATTMVKMRRLQKIEAALFQKARGLAEMRAQERQLIPALASPNIECTMLVAQLAAMPDMDRLASLQRYQNSLDRQLSKMIGELRVLAMSSNSTYTSASKTGSTSSKDLAS